MSRPAGLMVCSYSPVPETSGGRKRSARLAAAMARAGLEPHILPLGDDPDEAARAEMRERGWVVHDRVGGGRSSAPERLRQHARRLPRPHWPAVTARVRELAADAAVVQFEDIWAVQHALDARDAAPVVVSLYNVESLARAGGAEAGGTRERWRLASIGSVERRAVRRADLTVCVSEADEAHFRALGARNPLLIPNGVDERLFGLPAGPGEDGRLLFFGQLAYGPNSEGIERFLRRGWPHVREQEPDAVLRIAGPGAAPPLEQLAAATPGVELVGFVDDVAPELAAARAVVAPIRFGGGTRIKVLEAMAAARPVVGTGLAVEQIGFADGEHGRIRDDDEALARELVALLRDPGAAARLGAAAREHARRYAWTEVTRPLERFYERVAPAAASAAAGRPAS